MSWRSSSIFAVLAWAVVTAVSPVCRAEDDDDDHDRARAAVEQGKALPLSEILRRAKPALGGEILGIEFLRQPDGRWIYVFKIAAVGGELRVVRIDAATAAPIEDPDDE
jgi:uncharacterized membrane protein YkoI